MSSSPPSQPTAASASEPGVWTIGFVEDGPGGLKVTGDRPLNDETYEEYDAAVKFVLERQAQSALRLIIGNYGEFRALQTSMAIAFTTAHQANWPDAALNQFHLRRVLLNWLNSIRLFDDHNRTRIVRTYGESSPELDMYKAARSSIYDEVPSYRFMFELRNYAQHCGEVPIRAEVQQNLSGSSLDLYFDRDELLREFKKWKQVKKDLQMGTERIGLDTPIEETMRAVTRLAQDVATIDMPKFTRSVERVKEILGRAPEQTDRRTTILRMRFVNDDSGGQVMKMDVAPVLLVQPSPADQQRVTVEVPDFSSHRPLMTTERSSRRCQGPLNKVTTLPSESCQETATMSLYFPHQEGAAFLFACDQHALSLGQWAGKRFGGCFGGEAEKADVVMRLAAQLYARVDEPHGAEYENLIPVPGAPQTQSLFNAPVATGDVEVSSEET